MNLLRLFPSRILAVLFFDILILAGAYCAVVFVLLDPADQPAFWMESGWLRLAIAVASIIFGLFFDGLYGDVRVQSRVGLALQFCHVFGVYLIVQTLLAYVAVDLALPRRVVFYGTAACFPALFFWRLLYSEVVWKLLPQQSVLILGDGPLAQDIAREMHFRRERGFKPAGYISDQENPFHEEKFLGRLDDLDEVAKQLRPDRIVVALSQSSEESMPLKSLLAIRRRGGVIEDGVAIFESLYRRVSSRDFRPARFIFDQTLVHRPSSLALQSIYINILALAALIASSPVLILLAILVRISTRKSVFDPVLCTGYHGIQFNLIRFRTSVPNSNGTEICVNRLGKFMRRTYLDRLPTCINLLRGEMALVGPRPDRPQFSAELADRLPFYEQRYAVKPGITGWSQINLDDGPHQNDALLALEYDLYYLKHISLALDAYILIHRLRKIFSFAAPAR